MTTESSDNGAITTLRSNVSGYSEQMTM